MQPGRGSARADRRGAAKPRAGVERHPPSEAPHQRKRHPKRDEPDQSYRGVESVYHAPTNRSAAAVTSSRLLLTSLWARFRSASRAIVVAAPNTKVARAKD